MNKYVPGLVIIILILLAIHFAIDFFDTRSNIKSVMKKIQESQGNIDNALKEIKNSQDNLDALQSDLKKFSLYVKDIQGRVELDDLQKKYREETNNRKKDSIWHVIQGLEKELQKTDTLPPIPVN